MIGEDRDLQMEVWLAEELWRWVGNVDIDLDEWECRREAYRILTAFVASNLVWRLQDTNTPIEQQNDEAGRDAAAD